MKNYFNPLVPYIRNGFNSFCNSKFMGKACPKKASDIAATVALLSTTTKDVVNCYYYTSQSLNNKKIPEEKRKFVAGIDLANGILNFICQFTLGSLVNNKSGKIYDWMFKNSKPADKFLAETARGGFKLISVLVVTQVLAKRVIVPFLATPLAHHFKEYAEKQEKKHKPATEGADNQTEAQTINTKDEATKTINVVSTPADKKTNSTFKGFENMLNTNK